MSIIVLEYEIEHNYPHNASRCCIKIFEKWLSQQPNASFDQLLVALKKIDMNRAAEQIKGKSMGIFVP